MTDDGAEPEPDRGRRPRRHRRVTRPATGRGPDTEVPTLPGRDDTDAGWAPDAPDPQKRSAARPPEGSPQESAEDRWWREQRPPHWE